MLKAVIFDMDGVVVDSEPLIFEFEQEMFGEFGILVSEEVHLSLVGTTCEGFWAAIKEQYGLQQPLEEIVAESKRREIIAMERVELISGVMEFIKDLSAHGVQLILASSAPKKRIMVVMEKFLLDKLFSGFVSGDDVKKGKPDPEVFLLAAEKAAAEPGECVVIEDATHGVSAAKAAGMKCVGFDAMSGRQDLSRADLVVSGYGDLSYERLGGMV